MTFTKNHLRSASGFSLVELIITLGLMIFLVFAVTNRGSGSRQQRDIAQCEKNLQSMFTALTIYSADNGEKFPAVSNATTSEAPLSLLIPRCTTVTEIFICPGSKDSKLPEGEPFQNRKISYTYYMGLDKTVPSEQALISDWQINTNPKKVGEPLFSTDGKGAGGNHHKYGGNVLFASGEVRKSKAQSAFDLSFPTNVILLNPKS